MAVLTVLNRGEFLDLNMFESSLNFERHLEIITLWLFKSVYAPRVTEETPLQVRTRSSDREFSGVPLGRIRGQNPTQLQEENLYWYRSETVKPDRIADEWGFPVTYEFTPHRSRW